MSIFFPLRKFRSFGIKICTVQNLTPNNLNFCEGQFYQLSKFAYWHIKFVITNSKIVKEGIHADVLYVITGQFLQ